MKRRAALAGVLILLALLSGLLPLTYLGPVPLAGVLESGQADPARWWGGMLVAAGAAFQLRRGGGWARVVACATLSGVALWCWWASSMVAWQGLAQLALVAGAIVAFRRGAMAAFSVALLCGALGWMAWSDRIPNAQDGPVVGLMTALPLFWAEDAQGIDPGQNARDQKLIDTVPMRVSPVDHLDAVSLAGVRHLILAQPRLLQPTELVALDRWVRGGGRLVILADSLLAWPTGLALGDPRRPPVTSLLDPLFTHWGVRLAPGVADGVERRRLADGAALMLATSGHFVRIGQSACQLAEQGLFARCGIGKGRAVLIADADMLDDRLWLVRGERPYSIAAQASDAPPLLAQWLGTGDPNLPPRISDEQNLLAGLRAALILGLFGVALACRFLPGNDGKFWENRENAG